ncbi:MAG: hypothetical protein MK212_10455 [Saprospiraceae bacterium]|nr:hypothetical protein [Saprospiraceae bacterium]
MSNSKMKMPLILGGLAVVGIIIFLVLQNMSKSSELQEANTAILTLDQAKNKSDSLYRELRAQIDLYKDENDAMQSEVISKEDELEKLYGKINRLIKRAEQDKSEKKALEKQLKELSEEIITLKKFVDKQSQSIQELRDENERLRQEKAELNENLDSARTVNDQITDENNNLKDQNANLNDKVALASVLKVANITPKALRFKANGLEKETNVAKKVEKLNICFDIVRNEVAPEELDKFYLRITDPVGVAIIDEGRGSGRFKDVAQDRDVYFTTMKSFTYTVDKKLVCLDWAKGNNNFISGTYEFEIFNKGYLVGKSSFMLK